MGIIFGFTKIGRLQADTNLIAVFGLTLLFAGITIRWTAVYTLGKYFTGTVLIKEDHRLIRTGLYKRLRHPAYFVAAVLYRMDVEEQALREEFGEAYIRYSKATKRLIPRLY